MKSEKSEKMKNENLKEYSPNYSLVKAAFDIDDTIYVLDENGKFAEEKVISINKKTRSITTTAMEVPFEDHGWLWRCFLKER